MLISETSKKTKARQSLFGKRKALKQFAILTPENPMGKKLSFEENSKLRKDFESNLDKAKLFAFKTKGHYETNENSYIVFNVPFDTTERWAKLYDQESFIFARVKGENEVEFELWKKDASEFNKEATFKDKQYNLKEVQNKIIKLKDEADFYTTIGKGFKFSIPFKFFEAVSCYDNMFDEICLKDKEFENSYQNLINETISSEYTGLHRILIRKNLYKDFDGSCFLKKECDILKEVENIFEIKVKNADYRDL